MRRKKANVALGNTQSCVFTCTSTLTCYDRIHRCWLDLCFPSRFRPGMSNNKHVLDGYGLVFSNCAWVQVRENRSSLGPGGKLLCIFGCGSEFLDP